MKTISVSKAKASLSEQIRYVQRGEEIVITDRGEPVARLVPAEATSDDATDQALARAGLIRLARHPLPKSFWTRKRPSDPKGLVRAAVRLDRDESEH